MNQTKLSVNGNEYSFQNNSMIFQDSTGKERKVSFNSALKIKYSLCGKIKIVGKNTIPLEPPEENREKLFLNFFTHWRGVNPEAAKKAAFDYIDAQKGFVGLTLIVSIFLALPMAVGLLNDSREQYLCTNMLHAASSLGQMDITKFRKKRKGHYILDLKLTTPKGEVVLGHDQVITEDESSIPKTIPVVYSPQNPSCWSLTPNMSGTEVNWAKRRYFTVFTLLFGSFFLVCGLWGLLWSSVRFFQKRPYTKALKELFQL